MNLIKRSRYLTIACILLFLLILWINLLWGERIPVCHQLGFDGASYAEIALHLREMLASKVLDRYIIHRSLPSGLIWMFSNLTGISISIALMPMAFAILNGILISTSLYLWLLIAKHQDWSEQLKRLSFILLFINFAIFKMSTYYPILTDIPAFFLGTLLCFGVAKNQKHWIWISALLSLFAFPSHFGVAFIFLVFTKQEFLFECILKKNPSKIAALITLTLSMLSAVFYHRFHHKYAHISPLGKTSYLPVVILSLLLAMSLFFLALRNLLVIAAEKNPSSHLKFKSTFTSIKTALILLILLLLSYCITNPFSKNTTPLSLTEFVDHILTQPLAYPLIHWVSHTIYYGALIPLIILFWKPITKSANQMGSSFLIFLLFSLTLSIGSESRQFINLIPLLTFILCQTFHTLKIPIPEKMLFVFLVLNTLLSKIWLSLNHGQWPTVEALDHNVLLSLQSPMQWYFMQQGPWMSHTAYVINAIITILTFAICYFYFRYKNKTPL